MLYGTNPDETHLWITPHGLIRICVGDKSVWSDRMGQLVSSGDGKDAVLLSVSNAVISLSCHVHVTVRVPARRNSERFVDSSCKSFST